MDSYYFAAAFLDTIGYFDTSKRFWADKGQLPADTEPLRKAMIAQLKRFNSDFTVVDYTLERLGGRPASVVQHYPVAGWRSRAQQIVATHHILETAPLKLLQSHDISELNRAHRVKGN